jgi:hypothetical protein
LIEKNVLYKRINKIFIIILKFLFQVLVIPLTLAGYHPQVMFQYPHLRSRHPVTEALLLNNLINKIRIKRTKRHPIPNPFLRTFKIVGMTLVQGDHLPLCYTTIWVLREALVCPHPLVGLGVQWAKMDPQAHPILVPKVDPYRPVA